MFKHFATICIVYLQFIRTEVHTLPIDNETDIHTLEKQKQDLLKQIDEAIKESVKELEKSNDTQSLVSLNFINDIKKNILEGKDGRGEATETKLTAAETARRSKDVNIHLFDVINLSHKDDKKRDKKNSKARNENQAKMQAQIDEWLFNREQERARIKKIRESLKTTNAENCPRFGIDSGIGKKDKDKDKKGKEVLKYPCCRKCCKKSYMGCL